MFRYRLAQDAFESCCRSSVFVLLRLVTVVRPWYTYFFGRLNLLGTLLRHTYALADGLPGLRNTADEQPLLLLVDTTIDGASPSRARQE